MQRAFLSLIALLICSSFILSQDMAKVYEKRPYYIQSAMNFGKDQGGFWDIPGYPKEIKKGMNIQIFDLDENKDRKFYFVESSVAGYYEIIPGWERGIRLDIQGGKSKMDENGANIHTWTENGGDWQKFRLKHLGDGRFKIYTTNGKVICLANRSNKNRTNVHIWNDHDGDFMEWYLIEPRTKEPFIPKYIEPYSKKSPEFFERNKDAEFVYKLSAAFGPGSKGTAVVKSINNDSVVLTVNTVGINPVNGKKEEKTRDMTLNFKDGKYKNGDWNCMECAEGEVRILPDGKQILDMSGEQHAIEIILEAE